MRRVIAVFAASAAIIAGVFAASGPASAQAVRKPFPPPVITITDSAKGVLTTASPLVKGEVLSFFGHITGTRTVTSVRPDGPLLRITLSPGAGAAGRGQILDAHVVSVPLG